uniref:Bestrophin homolog n=1 Tax=Parascaris univalens TaxID=6257 RepID=A0A915CJJ4_PARUN
MDTKKSLLVCLLEEGSFNVGAFHSPCLQWRSCKAYRNDDVVFIDMVGSFRDLDVGSLTPMRLPGGKRNRQFDAAFVCLGVVVVLWKIGLLDHLLEKPFSEFRWPPYVDVRLEVALELNVVFQCIYMRMTGHISTQKRLPHCDEYSSESFPQKILSSSQ